ncbi:sigma-70 family RNA polymerase sigma factor [Sphingomonas hankookensis]|uniref:sigma-70 family RNA polymerase sigma factor n=1 Tax=Sphingomonas hankookensis TaxID=563996 RepID=UPI001F5A673C|nr:sigma-70 family RNA polymerase sigma factor [Sphingomonas hankookensis]
MRRIGRGLALVTIAPRAEASLWRRWRYEAEAGCREQIFVRYRSLAKAIAARQLSRRPAHGAELGDMQQFAYEGLLLAMERFDPLRGIPFPAFARRRIVGSISNGAARLGELDAQHHAWRRVADERVRSLAPRAPDAAPVDRLADVAAGLAIGVMLADTGMVEDANRGDHRPNAYESLAWRELHALLGSAIERLPERERSVIREHYEHGVRFAQIAVILGISRGRVSQLHASAIGRLRGAIGTIR